MSLVVVAVFLIGLVTVSGTFKILKTYQDRKTLELKHRQRMELLEGARDLVGLLLLDQELGETVITELKSRPEVKALPPAQVPEVASEPVVHWAQRVQVGRRVFWQTPCGLRSDRNNFVHTQGREISGTSCRSCQRSLLGPSALLKP